MNTLLVVDVQNDFLPGGALPVPEGDLVVPAINRMVPSFDLVIASQDWHPANHASFAAMHPGKKPGDLIELHGLPQRLWPAHCVQNTRGAEFAPDLHQRYFQHVVRKGTDPEIDSYSAFFDNARQKATGLESYLKERGVREFWLCGLATDYCVKFTALDAVSLGFKVHLILPACRGVNLHPSDVSDAIKEMRSAGVVIEDERHAGE